MDTVLPCVTNAASACAEDEDCRAICYPEGVHRDS